MCMQIFITVLCIIAINQKHSKLLRIGGEYVVVSLHSGILPSNVKKWMITLTNGRTKK